MGKDKSGEKQHIVPPTHQKKKKADSKDRDGVRAGDKEREEEK